MTRASTNNKGEATYERIIARALTLASGVGLEGLTIGELARDLGLSKSGLFAHFRSKEQLQLDVLDAAAEHFRRLVFHPALQVPRGRPRIESIFEHWLGWVLSEELQGGCIFLAGAAEWDDREGPVRERLVSWFAALDRGLSKAVRLAIDEGHFANEVDPLQFASEWHGIVMKYHLDVRLLRSPAAEAHARHAFEGLVQRALPKDAARRDSLRGAVAACETTASNDAESWSAPPPGLRAASFKGEPS